MVGARYTERTFELSRDAEQFRLAVRGIDTDHFTVERMAQSASFHSVTTPSPALFVARPSAGRCEVRAGDDEVRFARGDTVILDPHRPLHVWLDDVDYDVV